MSDERDAQVTALAALAEPTRRRLYEHVAAQPTPVSRDEAAGELGVPRATAAFHLDRLVAEGLLEACFERRSGRSGPGAGRPAKLYRRAECAVSVSVPERRYDLAGELLAAALVEAEESGESPRAVLARRARQRGREIGSEVREAGGERRAVVLEQLARYGFEPVADDAAVRLRNCPFHTLARTATELVCGMNLALVEGVVEGAAAEGLTPRLAPQPGACCVRLDTPAGDGPSG